MDSNAVSDVDESILESRASADDWKTLHYKFECLLKSLLPLVEVNFTNFDLFYI